MAVVSPERLRGDVERLVHRTADVPGFTRETARILARAVPFDGICLLTMDPATLLPTGEVVENGLPAAATARIAEIEIRGTDFNTFAVLARSAPHAASLSGATGGDLDRSRRHREVKRRHGFGDELRAVLVGDTSAWGALTLLRGDDRRPFTPEDTALIASVIRHLGEGLRRAMLVTAVSAAHGAAEEPAGLIMLTADNAITHADPAGEMWLAALSEPAARDPLPAAVRAVANRARAIAAGEAHGDALARARVRTASGRWLLVRGSTLDAGAGGQTAVIVEPARPHELAPLIADAHGLTARERAVTQFVAQGLGTNAIAARLHISPWTVQDHLKAVFEKVDVGSRGELVARLFFEHYAPRLSDGAPVGSDGWFAPAAPEGGPRAARRVAD